jgi:hypothetical protein
LWAAKWSSGLTDDKKKYVRETAAVLLKWARSTRDPEVAVALVTKAADHLSQADEPIPEPDRASDLSD